MRPSHFVECLSEMNHFFGGDEECTEFSFRRGGKDEFQDLGDAKDGSVPGLRGKLSDRKMWAPTRLLPLVSLLNPASE